MSTALFDVILLWVPEQPDPEYTELRKLLDVDYANQFRIQAFTNTQEAISAVKSKTKSAQPLIVITKLGKTADNLGQPLIEDIRRREKQTFIILHSHTVCNDPNTRWDFAALGVNMITTSIPQMRNIFNQLIPLRQPQPDQIYTCFYCKLSSLSFSQLYAHVPIYHTNEQAVSGKCEICKRSSNHLGVHLIEDHIVKDRTIPEVAPLHAFSLVVCQRKSDQRFLVVQEAGSMGYWLPGGRVEVGEQLDEAAVRETLEEAGVKVRITGVLRFEFTPRMNSNRLRVIFFAEPLDENNCEPKQFPDYESYGAMWMTYAQVVECSTRNQLRGSEPLKWFKYITQNGAVHPLSILSKTEV